ncbi:tetratricopeptide repeat protein [Halobacillus seohaensis]|uniref:Tetratricopeptide repeat protein n=1 Tax=Halobacillus seohaensis TaxID=447421 RepID=A0ABW2ELL1_9BACI
MKGNQINPRFIQMLTGRKKEDVKENPSIVDLKSDHTKVIVENRESLRPESLNSFKLKCGHCNQNGIYEVGKVAINVMDKKKPTHEDFQLNGYFRCKHCNAAGDWELPTDLMMLGITAMITPEKMADRCFVGKNAMFDGSSHRFATDGEEHLLDLLEQNPKDAFLWNRLGNLFQTCGRPELAAASFEKSISYQPDQLESQYSLGFLFEDVGEFEKAADHYEKVLIAAESYKEFDAPKLRDMLASTLNLLFCIHLKTDETIPFLSEYVRDRISEVVQFKFTRVLDWNPVLDPADYTTFYPLAEAFMGEQSKQIPKSEQVNLPSSGSGKKKKRKKRRKR